MRRWLEGVPACRVVELPRRQADERGESAAGDVARRQRLAAITAAYHAAAATVPDAGGRLLLGWHRAQARDPVSVFTAGGIESRPAADGQVPLVLPPGGVGVRIEAGRLIRMLDNIPYWTRIAGLTDGLLVDDTSSPSPDEVPPSLDECLLRVWREAFAWLVIAEPLPPNEIGELIRAVAVEERAALAKASSPEQAIRAARMSRRHRELCQGESSGMWRVHLLAGGGTPAGAAAVAGLLCSSADLRSLPYALAPTGVTGGLTAMLAAELSFVASSLMVAALAATPAEEVPGVRMALRSEFDVTPESVTDPLSGMTVGAVLDRNGDPSQDLRLALPSLNRHTFVCGATGAGKSQTVRHLLEQATAAGLPWLVVEPAKAEYRRMADRIGPDRVITIRPGEVDSVPAGFNPLKPAAGFPLQTHADLVRALFLAAFQSDEPFPQVLSASLVRCYEELGWDLALGEPAGSRAAPRYPTLGDLQRAAERVVDEIGYGREVTDNVRGFIRVRLSSLRLGTTGRFFEGGHPLDFAELLRRNVVFEIEDVGDDRDKAFLMGALLIQLVEHLRVESRIRPELADQGLRHLTVFEEAHRLLRRTEHAGPAGHAVELFAALLAEIRAYGEGLIIAEQIPSKLVPDVIKNTSVKIMHRLPALDDREMVGATANLTERQSRYLVTLTPGMGAVFADGMDHPLLVQVPDGTRKERGGLVTTAAHEIIGRRSETCGTSCLAAACTLREMRTAQHMLDEDPWLVLWAELAVVGHLTGWPVPPLRARQLTRAWELPERTLHCGLSHAVDDAIAVRSAVMPAHLAPAELATHVIESLTGQLRGEARCGDAELAYLARPYRWARLWDDLRAAELSSAHPRTAEWELHYGRAIPGATTAEQAEAVRQWLDADQRDPEALRLVAFGARSPSTLEHAVESTFGADEWQSRLSEKVAEHFAGITWPEHSLSPRLPRTGGESGG